jgi:hypothetical protein
LVKSPVRGIFTGYIHFLAREQTAFANTLLAPHITVVAPEPGAHWCTKPAAAASRLLATYQTKTSTVAARFFSDRVGPGHICAHALLRLVPNRAPEKKPVPFRSSGPHSLPRREVSQRPMRLFPCITRAFWRDPDEWAARSYCQFQERLAAECHSTSFKHALYWLMRNLLKIPRGAAAVNVRWISAGLSA